MDCGNSIVDPWEARLGVGEHRESRTKMGPIIRMGRGEADEIAAKASPLPIRMMTGDKRPRI